MKRIKKMSKYVILITIIIIMILGLGYRFTGLQAAKNHFEISKDHQLIGQVNYNW